MSVSTQRYVLAVGEVSEGVASHDGVVIIEQLDNVVLVETSIVTASRLRRAGRPHVHVYESERAARAALGLFAP
jgi:hypothetical protein